MNEERAFLTAVLAAPDDDVPRLVYADWLDDHGRPERAALIRAQCELATLTEDSPRRRLLAFQARELLDRHAADWVEPYGIVPETTRFVRGFVEAIEVDAVDLGRPTARLFRDAPVRRVRVAGLEAAVRHLRKLRSPTVTALDLGCGELTAAALRRLAKVDSLAGVRELRLLFNELRDAAAQVLLAEPFYRRMDAIHCGGNPLTESGRRRLRDAFGDRVSFACERDAGHLYAFNDHRFRTGYTLEDTQSLMLAGRMTVRLALFDHAGHLLRTDARPAGDDYNATAAGWQRELDWQDAPIRVQRFCFPHGAGVFDYPDHFVEAFDNFDGPEREPLRRAMLGWLADGQFRFDYGGSDVWLDRSGEVTDT